MPTSNIPCRFYATSVCRNGATCKFAHVSTEEYALILSASGASGGSSSSNSHKYPCRFFMKGSCLRGQTCKFSHDSSFIAAPVSEQTDPDIDDSCSICFEKPQMFGLLLNCNHSFCLNCVRKWRKISCKEDAGPDMKTGHLCPMCRAISPYVVPSIVGFPKGGPGKDKTIELYRTHLASLDCKYFFKSPVNQRFCPYGDDCLYRHPSNHDENVRYHFGPSYIANLKEKRERRRRIRMLSNMQMPQVLEEYLMGAALSTDDELSEDNFDGHEHSEDEQYLANLARHFNPHRPEAMHEFIRTMNRLALSEQSPEDSDGLSYDYNDFYPDEYDLDTDHY